MLHRNWKATGLGGISLALLAAGTLAGSTGTSVALAAGAGDGTVTVRVVTEVDADGAYDSVLEPGLSGVKVTLTDDAGATLTATTGADGTAVFTPSSSALTGGKYRIQVANPDPDTLSPANAGLGTGADVIRSGVGFVDVGGGTNVTYTTGFWEPDLYCQENPALVTCGLAKGDATGQQGLVSFPSGFASYQDGPLTQLTDNTQQQAVFGIGTDRTGNVYAGTSVKRHTEYGPAGAVNAVYRYNATSKALTTFVTLPGALTAHDKNNNYLNDNAVYAKVGREGLGDVDVSGDGKTLYAVNLNDAKLYAVPIQGTGDAVTAGTPASYAIPKPASCVGDWHPYGIGVRGARVVVGGVCGAETTVSGTAAWGDPAQLSGHVYAFKGGQFSELFTHGLDYPRGCAYRFTGTPDTFYRCDDNTTVGQRMSGDWEAWNERVPVKEEHGFVAAPQPMLSNIEIADNGDLILGYRDRFADMQGTNTYSYGSTTTQVSAVAAGDTLRACVSGTTYTLENDGGCGGLTGALPGDKRGPGGGEFYSDFTKLADAQHDQIDEGGLVLQPYRNKLWTTAFDPYTNQAYEQGVRRWTADSGAIEANLRLKSTWSDGANLFGKGNGLADLEMICDQAPVQIGNRVWYDSDGDGVQDPSEPPVAGVKVTLKDKDGNTLTTTTDANGEYYVGTADGLKPNTEYEVTFDYSGIDTSTLPGKPALDEIKWTLKEAGSDRAIDSNVDPAGKTTVKVGDPGYVNHDVDAGLVGPINKLGDYVWYDTNGDGIQDKDEKGAKGITVKLIDPKTGKVIRTTTTDENGKYLFTNLPDGDYRVCFVKPDEYNWTKQNAGREGDDSVVDPATGCSPVVTLGPGKRENLTLDAGLVKELGLTVAKTDAKTKKPLAGAVFQLWRDSNGTHGLQRTGPKKDTFVDDCVTSGKGRCYFDDLPAGTYYLVETDVPEGYVLPKRPVTGPYAVTLKTASSKDGLVVKIANKRGEPCKGKC
ncbi:SdrD B-like domain-containing protein [Streptomyces aquilus]|uniref:SdrD B-like domain-containing protein n=1 Tax=Streptomyces aquilus TaxID=2548456 RepID=UPI00244A8E68|nr:SdrD B-like domain-containing protein [Streptomyces aquilus]